MVNFHPKISSWLISNVSIRFILLQFFFLGLATCWLGSTGRSQWGGSSWPRSRSTLLQSAQCMYMVFSSQSLIGTCQILKGCAGFQKDLHGLKQNFQNSCQSVIGFPIECPFHQCRNQARGWGIGGIRGNGRAQSIGTSIAEEAMECGGLHTGWYHCIIVLSLGAAEDETVVETLLCNSRRVSRLS